MKKVNVAIVGATGNVGQEIIKTLAERGFETDQIAALASKESVGREVSYGEKTVLTVQSIEKFDFTGYDLCFFAAGSKVSEAHAPRAAAAGCIVIDDSPFFRMNPDIPLIVPEVNKEALAGYTKKNIISSPSSIAIQLMVALKPLHDLATIKRVVVSSYQAVSSEGRLAMDELFTQTRGIYVNDAMTKEYFKKQIAFNVIPQIDDFREDGTTGEEWNLTVETKKILDPKIKVTATCVRVPVFIGHGLAVNIEFEHDIDASETRAALKSAQGITIIDHKHEEGFVTPAESVGEDSVYVSRIREDSTLENGLNLWIVCDNLRKGSALNVVQIAEILVKDYL